VMRLDQAEGLRSGQHRVHGVAIEDEDLPEGVEDDLFIVHAQDARDRILHLDPLEGWGLA